MRKVLVLDCSGGSLLKVVQKYFPSEQIKVEENVITAMVRIDREPFDLILASQVSGRADILDFVEAIKYGRLTRKCEVIIVEDHPTKAHRAASLLRGRSVAVYKSTELNKIDEVLKKALD